MESWFKLIILVSILRQIQRQSSRNPRGELLSQWMVKFHLSTILVWKNLLWVLVRIHASEKQSVLSWTASHILVRNKYVVAGDNVYYLPIINAPATNMSTVSQVLMRSIQIKETLNLQSRAIVFDQALYAKATVIKWKHREQFKDLLLRVDVFHTICTFLSVTGKHF